MNSIPFAIIGTGPAAQFTFEGLVNSGVKIEEITLFEAGTKLDLDKNFKEVLSKKLPIEIESRNLQFGGTSNTWTGLCSIFDKDEINLFKNDHTWKIVFEDIQKYYKLLVNKFNFPKIEIKEDFLFDSSIKFKFRKFITIKKLLNIVRLNSIESRTKTSHQLLNFQKKKDSFLLSFKNLNSNENYNVTCQKLIIACGGLENIRIILDSFNGKEFSYDKVGRYFTNHPKFLFGRVTFNVYSNTKEFEVLFKNGFVNYFGISLCNSKSKSTQLNPYVRFEPEFSWNNDFLTNFLISVFNKLKFAFFSSRVKNFKTFFKDKSSKILNIKNIINEQINFLPIMKLLFYKLKFYKPYTKTYNLRNYLEMAPKWENRVTIEKLDQLPSKIIVEYEIGESELNSITDLHRELKKCFKSIDAKFETNLSKVEMNEFVADASHHCGGTILGANKFNSVVDKNLELHDYKGCYVVGSSVFPTSGSVNPTYTIAAMGYRLGNYLSSKH